MSARATVLMAAVAIGTACRATAPSCTDQHGRGETGLNALDVSCSATASDLQCQAVASIKGLYVYCPMQQIVTQSAMWTAGDSSVVRVAAPGIFQAIGRGDTFVRASWQGLESFVRPVSVFADTPPLPTQEIFGTVYQRGLTPAAGAINGAVVEILDGASQADRQSAAFLHRSCPDILARSVDPDTTACSACLPEHFVYASREMAMPARNVS